MVRTITTMLKSLEITRLFLILPTCFDGNFCHRQCNGCLIRVYLIGTSVKPVKIKTCNHLNHLHDFKGFVNQWPLMHCVQTESRQSDFIFCFSIKCEASFKVCQLPNSSTATDWMIFRISASIYVISIVAVVLFDTKKWLEFSAIKPLWLAPQNAENRIPEVQNFKNSQGSMPPEPPRYSRLWQAFISRQTLPLNLIVSALHKVSCLPKRSDL